MGSCRLAGCDKFGSVCGSYFFVRFPLDAVKIFHPDSPSFTSKSCQKYAWRIFYKNSPPKPWPGKFSNIFLHFFWYFNWLSSINSITQNKLSSVQRSYLTFLSEQVRLVQLQKFNFWLSKSIKKTNFKQSKSWHFLFHYEAERGKNKIWTSWNNFTLALACWLIVFMFPIPPHIKNFFENQNPGEGLSLKT